jgi:hypothetical protein
MALQRRLGIRPERRDWGIAGHSYFVVIVWSAMRSLLSTNGNVRFVANELSALQPMALILIYSGHAAPVVTHSAIDLTNSSWDMGGTVRLSPGSHPHRTIGVSRTCSSISSRFLPPFSLGSLRCSHIRRGVLFWKTIGIF